MLGFEKAVGRAVLAAPPAGFGPQAGSPPPRVGVLLYKERCWSRGQKTQSVPWNSVEGSVSG